MLDNGYISEQAKTNVSRIADKLGLELVIGRVPAMNEIFVDSLTRFSNVCNGCFKTIYTLSMNLARERGINTIITGLSRGQIFETRLAEFFKQRIFDPLEIDRQIIEARKVYHRMDDAVCRALDVAIFKDDAVFDEIQFVDFYRYCDVTLDEVYAYLATRAPWIRPSDTGRSTNCLINEVGIHVHKTERGFHNYSLPYSWDVRLGHKQRDAAREELDDEINAQSVVRILGEIGYDSAELLPAESWQKRLIAYYVAAEEQPQKQLRSRLMAILPQELVPHQFIHLQELPLTANGKVDRAALPHPDAGSVIRAAQYLAPVTSVERQLASFWEAVLGVEDVGVNDDFFDLGGDSILNIQIVAAARAAGLVISPEQIFEHTTIAALARAAGTEAIQSDQGAVTGRIPLLPSQRRFFEERWSLPNQYCQVVSVNVAETLDEGRLRTALKQVLTHHDALRACFEETGHCWIQTIKDVESATPVLQVLDLAGVPARERELLIRERTAGLCRSFDICTGDLVTLLYCNDPQAPVLVLVIHQLVVDAVSWGLLLTDLESTYLQLQRGDEARLPAKTTSLRDWSEIQHRWSRTTAAAAEARFWSGLPDAVDDLPVDVSTGANSRDSICTTSVSLDIADTAALTELSRAQRAHVLEILVASLSGAFNSLAIQEQCVLQIDLEGHGREELMPQTDLLRTVGWFTSLYPVPLTLDATRNPVDTLRLVREQLRAIPSRGAGFGILRNLADPELIEVLAGKPRSQVLFNFLGQWSNTLASPGLFQLAQPIQIVADASGQRPYLLEINAMVFQGQLRVDWVYSANRHLDATIQRYAAEMISFLQRLLETGIANPDVTLAPSDFPDAELNQDDLDDLLADLDRIDD